MRMLSRVWGLEQIRMKYIKLLIAWQWSTMQKKKKKFNEFTTVVANIRVWIPRDRQMMTPKSTQ